MTDTACLNFARDSLLRIITETACQTFATEWQRETLLQSDDMTVSTENATPPQSTKSRNSNSSVQIQIKSEFQFEFVPRDTEISKYLDLVDFGCAAFSVDSVIRGKERLSCKVMI